MLAYDQCLYFRLVLAEYKRILRIINGMILDELPVLKYIWAKNVGANITKFP